MRYTVCEEGSEMSDSDETDRIDWKRRCECEATEQK